MKFEWDKDKRAGNILKHGIDFVRRHYHMAFTGDRSVAIANR